MQKLYHFFLNLFACHRLLHFFLKRFIYGKFLAIFQHFNRLACFYLHNHNSISTSHSIFKFELSLGVPPLCQVKRENTSTKKVGDFLCRSLSLLLLLELKMLKFLNSLASSYLNFLIYKRLLCYIACYYGLCVPYHLKIFPIQYISV